MWRYGTLLCKILINHFLVNCKSFWACVNSNNNQQQLNIVKWTLWYIIGITSRRGSICRKTLSKPNTTPLFPLGLPRGSTPHLIHSFSFSFFLLNSSAFSHILKLDGDRPPHAKFKFFSLHDYKFWPPKQCAKVDYTRYGRGLISINS